jgi:hypothetical protein
MLVLKFGERWRVERARFSSFVCKSMFPGVFLTVLHSQFINVGNLRFVISLLKQISNEDFGSKS